MTIGLPSCFFFSSRRRHTRCSRDWSSDVCSSDLLDELPQLLNILRGEMSVVGPRPSLPSEVLRYEQWQYRRFAVLPGLTCLWQVCPDPYRMSFDEWLRLDPRDVDDSEPRLGLAPIPRTFPGVLRGKGEELGGGWHQGLVPAAGPRARQ